MKSLALVSLLAFALTAAAQEVCSGPSCPRDAYRWITWDKDPGRAYLFQADRQIGAFDLREFYYRPFDAVRETWGVKAKPPIEPPCFGVDPDKLGPADKYTLSGQVVPRQAVHAALEKGLEDDSQKLRVTVTSPSADKRRAIVQELRQMPDAAAFTIRDYDPQSWEMSSGFHTAGDPTLYCQTPAGKVLHRQDDYAGGAEAVVGALRKARANYDPKKDPDLRRATLPLVPANSLLFAILAGVLTAGLLPHISRKVDSHASH